MNLLKGITYAALALAVLGCKQAEDPAFGVGINAVKRQIPNPDDARFKDLALYHYIVDGAEHSALCGVVSYKEKAGSYSPYTPFIADGQDSEGTRPFVGETAKELCEEQKRDASRVTIRSQ